MADIYEPPKAELNHEYQPFKRSIWWKIYFFIITILSFLGMASYLMSDGSGIVEFAQTVLLVIATAGFFGFVYNKRVLFPKFWIPFLVLYFVSGLLYVPLTNVDIRQGMSDLEFYISSGIGMVISLPAYWALYCYGLEKNRPWSGS